jgi:hypothetical protein
MRILLLIVSSHNIWTRYVYAIKPSGKYVHDPLWRVDLCVCVCVRVRDDAQNKQQLFLRSMSWLVIKIPVGFVLCGVGTEFVYKFRGLAMG